MIDGTEEGRMVERVINGYEVFDAIVVDPLLLGMNILYCA